MIINYKKLNKTLSLIKEAFPDISREDAAKLYDFLREEQKLCDYLPPRREALRSGTARVSPRDIRDYENNRSQIRKFMTGTHHPWVFWRLYKGGILLAGAGIGLQDSLIRKKYFDIPIEDFFKEEE